MTTNAHEEVIKNADANLNSVGLPTYTEALDALRLNYATYHPFISKEEGGLGLAYVSDNLLHEAWVRRQKAADDSTLAVLSKAFGLRPYQAEFIATINVERRTVLDLESLKAK